MNHRERILALTVLAVAILVGGGVLFKFLFLDALSAVHVQTADAEQELDKKKAEVDRRSGDDRTVDPDAATRAWRSGSVSACRRTKTRQKELKEGRSLEEIRKSHEEGIQVSYEQFLIDLLRRSGFRLVDQSDAGARGSQRRPDSDGQDAGLHQTVFHGSRAGRP